MAEPVTVDDARLGMMIDCCENVLGVALHLRPEIAAEYAYALRELQAYRAGDAETDTLRRELAPALALKLEAVRAKCAVSHELRLSDYEQGRQDIANEVLDILDAPAPAPAGECRFCRGTGRWPGSTDKCDRCGGSGKAPAPAEEPPQFFEIPPIDLTGGQDAADYVAEMRDREDAAALAAVREEAGE